MSKKWAGIKSPPILSLAYTCPLLVSNPNSYIGLHGGVRKEASSTGFSQEKQTGCACVEGGSQSYWLTLRLSDGLVNVPGAPRVTYAAAWSGAAARGNRRGPVRPGEASLSCTQQALTHRANTATPFRGSSIHRLSSYFNLQKMISAWSYILCTGQDVGIIYYLYWIITQHTAHKGGSLGLWHPGATPETQR